MKTWLLRINPGGNSMTIVLDNIRSAWNVGSIMRTCDAVGANIILIGYTPKPVGDTLKLVKKTAIGAENTVSWEHFDHFNEVLDKYPGSIHIGLELSSESQNMFDFLKKNTLPEDKVFLWFGNEIHGLEQSLIQRLNHTLFLPMKGTKESLNVATCVTACGYLLKYANYN